MVALQRNDVRYQGKAPWFPSGVACLCALLSFPLAGEATTAMSDRDDFYNKAASGMGCGPRDNPVVQIVLFHDRSTTHPTIEISLFAAVSTGAEYKLGGLDTGTAYRIDDKGAAELESPLLSFDRVKRGEVLAGTLRWVEGGKARKVRFTAPWDKGHAARCG